MELHAAPILTENRGRRRSRNKECWNKDKLKSQSVTKLLMSTCWFLCYCYKSKSLPRKVNCTHHKKTFLCIVITLKAIMRFHEAFYSTNYKSAQDNFLHNVLLAKKYPSRKRPSEMKGPPKKYNNFLLLEVKITGYSPVVDVSKAKVPRVCKTYLTAGKYPKENKKDECQNLNSEFALFPLPLYTGKIGSGSTFLATTLTQTPRLGTLLLSAIIPEQYDTFREKFQIQT
ncbi:hypothetical protein PR048_009753 [Dryococelus australis]|uniref:Uncharacterized protein n=1 Tax=Dryococelus australis TaxID=614101 RepID=A0ABQ9I1U3_9NEOP|nr:hypothetical protein PR048_009753 [Dryococelus australis]